MKKDESTTVRVPRDLLAQVNTIAEKHHRTLQGEVTYALEKYVEAHPQIVGAEGQR